MRSYLIRILKVCVFILSFFMRSNDILAQNNNKQLLLQHCATISNHQGILLGSYTPNGFKVRVSVLPHILFNNEILNIAYQEYFFHAYHDGKNYYGYVDRKSHPCKSPKWIHIINGRTGWVTREDKPFIRFDPTHIKPSEPYYFYALLRSNGNKQPIPTNPVIPEKMLDFSRSPSVYKVTFDAQGRVSQAVKMTRAQVQETQRWKYYPDGRVSEKYIDSNPYRGYLSLLRIPLPREEGRKTLFYAPTGKQLSSLSYEPIYKDDRKVGLKTTTITYSPKYSKTVVARVGKTERISIYGEGDKLLRAK